MPCQYRKILLSLLIVATNLCAASAIVDFYLKIDPKTGYVLPEVGITWIQVSYGEIGKPVIPKPINSSEKYYRIVMEYGGSVLLSEKFGVPVFIKYVDYKNPTLVYDYPPHGRLYSDNNTGREFVFAENATEVEFIIPFYHHSQIIKIYRDETLLFSAPLSEYLCSEDSICAEGEDYLSCPSDCRSGGRDDFCDRMNDGICDPDCYIGFDPDCESMKDGDQKTMMTIETIVNNRSNSRDMIGSDNAFIIVVLSIILLIVIVVFYLYFIKRGSKV